MTGSTHATMQDAHNNHFFGRHAVENYVRTLRDTTIPSSNIGSAPACFGKLAQLSKPTMQIVDITHHLSVAPVIECIGGNRHDVVSRTRRQRNRAHDN